MLRGAGGGPRRTGRTGETGAVVRSVTMDTLSVSQARASLGNAVVMVTAKETELQLMVSGIAHSTPHAPNPSHDSARWARATTS